MKIQTFVLFVLFVSFVVKLPDHTGNLGRVALQILAQAQQRQVARFGLEHDVEGRLAVRHGQKRGELEQIRVTMKHW